MPITVNDLAQDIARIEDEINGLGRDMARQAGEAIVGFSPVLTGFFVSNWNDSTGGPNPSVSGTRPTGSTRVLGDPSFSVENTWTIADGDIVFANGVDYADALDAGGSAQAPQGITDPVAALIDARFRRFDL